MKFLLAAQERLNHIDSCDPWWMNTLLNQIIKDQAIRICHPVSSPWFPVQSSVTKLIKSAKPLNATSTKTCILYFS
jgi:hypothetical protein